MDVKLLTDRILVWGGAIAITVGAYLPWLKRDPNVHLAVVYPEIIPAAIDISSGFDGYGFVFLSMLGVVLLLRAVSSRTWLPPVVTLLSGGGIVAGCVYYLFSSNLTGVDSTFVLAVGWYLTVFGGILLFVAGGLRLLSLTWSPRNDGAEFLSRYIDGR